GGRDGRAPDLTSRRADLARRRLPSRRVGAERRARARPLGARRDRGGGVPWRGGRLPRRRAARLSARREGELVGHGGRWAGVEDRRGGPRRAGGGGGRGWALGLGDDPCSARARRGGGGSSLPGGVRGVDRGRL